MHADLPSMRAVGYRQAWGHLAGDYDLARCRDLAIFATRQLAKRQWTWLRGMPGVEWIDSSNADAFGKVRAHVCAALTPAD
jgi:tRNA dimethylallyltransferase